MILFRNVLSTYHTHIDILYAGICINQIRFKKLLKTKIRVAVGLQPLAGSGRLLLRPCLFALVGATHSTVDPIVES